MPQHFKVQVGHVKALEGNKVQVAMVIRHPKYNLAQGAQGGADVALLKLESPVTLSHLVKCVALPPASFRVASDMRCWVTGWGDIHPAGENQDHELETPG